MQGVAMDVVVAAELKQLEREIKQSPGALFSRGTDIPKPPASPMEADRVVEKWIAVEKNQEYAEDWEL